MTINDLVRAITPSESARRILIEGFARGALWAGVLLTVAILPVFLGSLSTPLTFDEFARFVVITAISAAGGLVSVTSEALFESTGTIFAEIGVRPTLITLLIGFLAYRAGGKVKEFRGGDVSLRRLSTLSSLGLGAGFVAVLFATSFLASGSLNSVPGVSLEAIGLTGILWIFFVVALPAWLGSMKYLGRKSSSSWKWGFASLRTFAGFYGVLLLLAAIVFFVSTWISPDWGPSLAKLPPVPAGEFGWREAAALAQAIGAFLIVLPAILFTILSLGIGANYALQFGIFGTDILAAVDSFVPGFDLSTISNFSVASNFGAWPFVLVLAAVVLTSLISGARASGEFGDGRPFRREFLVVGAVALVVGLIGKSITGVELFWSNRGKPQHLISDGELLLQEGFASFGISTVSLTLLLVAIALFLASGATFARDFMADAFPRLYSGSLSGSASESRGLVAQVFGIVTSIALLAAVVVPIAGASVERAWASIDGPAQHFDGIAKTIEGDDLEATKKLFGFKEANAKSWLPDAVMVDALPKRQQRTAISVSNWNDDAWQVGNLDAKTSLIWELEDGKVKLPLTAEGELKEFLWIINHPEFTSKPAALDIRFSTGPALRGAGKSKVTVNGQEIDRGTYKALPGSYELVVPGFKLIAPASQKFFTSGQSLDFIAPEIIQLTAQQETIMDKAFAELAKECGEPQVVTRPDCFSFKDIYSFRTTESGFDADEYFALQSKNFEIVDSKCSTTLTDEVAAADVTFRTELCSATVKFDVEYFDSKLEERAIFETQRYNGCPEVTFAFCERFRQVRVGTAQVEVRNKSLGKAKLVSNIPYELSLFGVLDDKGEFTARDSWVAPKPTEPKPEEPKEPKPIKLLGRYENVQDMIDANPNPRLGDGYVVGADLMLWVWNGSAWIEIGRR